MWGVKWGAPTVLRVAVAQVLEPLRETNQPTRDFAGAGHLLPAFREVLSW
jgi:hypothetical protein